MSAIRAALQHGDELPEVGNGPSLIEMGNLSAEYAAADLMAADSPKARMLRFA